MDIQLSEVTLDYLGFGLGFVSLVALWLLSTVWLLEKAIKHLLIREKDYDD